MAEVTLSRRRMLAAGIAALSAPALPGVALAQPAIGRSMPREFNLAIENVTLNITGTPRPAVAINRSVPAPVLHFREGEEVSINVANRLRESTSIHWHGLILPSGQDGVPGISDGFQGIAAGETHQYRFPLVQAGTYWYHSHSGVQEQAGMYGPMARQSGCDWRDKLDESRGSRRGDDCRGATRVQGFFSGARQSG
ncbi:multicopper oxidase domain-containing protein [Roseomonas chloroacetimidivorans]|uniref:multicopper oxidase domain-containing protein n=1 Tax=Roseomonas chloroacetimidivorans TaxID=1766656 RepID=UPI003C76FF8D